MLKFALFSLWNISLSTSWDCHVEGHERETMRETVMLALSKCASTQSEPRRAVMVLPKNRLFP